MVAINHPARSTGAAKGEGDFYHLPGFSRASECDFSDLLSKVRARWCWNGGAECVDFRNLRPLRRDDRPTGSSRQAFDLSRSNISREDLHQRPGPRGWQSILLFVAFLKYFNRSPSRRTPSDAAQECTHTHTLTQTVVDVHKFQFFPDDRQSSPGRSIYFHEIPHLHRGTIPKSPLGRKERGNRRSGKSPRHPNGVQTKSEEDIMFEK